ncbi:MAG: bifunctional folylpolyglutamate synthase/dihydrofolate synthase [Deltaproteobacteria bacterium]|nr:bifunctional folylpolyglutamate synthase/dihydrofolate synthase [Deltaproteobacteria bacterium]
MTGRTGPGRPETIQPGLERILAAFGKSGHPERAFRILHIAGTNGKGSTAAFLESILRRLHAGPIGLFTSPHLMDPEERIRIDGRNIPAESLRRALRRAAALSRSAARDGGEPLSYFEEMTWAACDWFRKGKSRLVVMEAGLGGRWDATNACIPEVSVVTTVAIDHREWLGKTLREIAAEKAGIFRPGVPVLLGRLTGAARKVALRRALEIGAPVWESGRDFGWEEASPGRIRIRLPGIAVSAVRPGMAGDFQRDNAALACAAAWRWATAHGGSSGAFRRAAAEGSARARWPGRFCPLPGRGNRGAWTDGAHNPHAAAVLARELGKMRSGGGTGRVIALWSMLGDKDRSGFLREMSRAVDGWVPYPMEHERAAALRDLAAACSRRRLSVRPANDFPEGWSIARKWAGAGGMVIVCGSLAAVGDAFRHRVGRIP